MATTEATYATGGDVMTHDELLAKIDHMWDDDFDYVIEQNRKALRAVVELHKPSGMDDYFCSYCPNTYPCHTIEAIEKELN